MMRGVLMSFAGGLLFGAGMLAHPVSPGLALAGLAIGAAYIFPTRRPQ